MGASAGPLDRSSSSPGRGTAAARIGGGGGDLATAAALEASIASALRIGNDFLEEGSAFGGTAAARAVAGPFCIFTRWAEEACSATGGLSPKDGDHDHDQEEGGSKESGTAGPAAEASLSRLHAVCWTQLHGGNAKQADLSPWREALALCCLMQGLLALVRGAAPASSPGLAGDPGCSTTGTAGVDGGGGRPIAAARAALRLMDLGLVVAGPEALASATLFCAARDLAASLAAADADAGQGAAGSAGRDASAGAEAAAAAAPEGPPLAKRPRRLAAAGGPLVRRHVERPALQHRVHELPPGAVPGLEEFLLSYLASSRPVLIPQGCGAWPAVERWASESFWRDGGLGQRFVPVETDYYFRTGGYSLLRLRDFVDQLRASEVAEAGPQTAANAGRRGGPAAPGVGLSRGGYLAQHPLLDQVPSLAADVPTPDLALCGSDGHLVRKVFFGPLGTVTPLHVDPYENLFCQVVGAKYVRLYPPAEAARLYPRGGDDGERLGNNSAVEPADLLEGQADGRFPLLSKATYLEAVLEPGDLLYLPRGWWHFIKSLSISISVAFHFS